jgi:ribonuclease BN (tRNA processing enzyme)
VGNLRLEPDETQHYVRTWGFRISATGADEDPNRILTYSADSGPCDALARLADGADLFLCEAALRSLKEDDPEPQSRGHLLPSEAGETARASGARKLLLTHIPIADGGDWALGEARSAYDGTVEIAEPLRSYEV